MLMALYRTMPFIWKVFLFVMFCLSFFSLIGQQLMKGNSQLHCFDVNTGTQILWLVCLFVRVCVCVLVCLGVRLSVCVHMYVCQLC